MPSVPSRRGGEECTALLRLQLLNSTRCSELALRIKEFIYCHQRSSFDWAEWLNVCQSVFSGILDDECGFECRVFVHLLFVCLMNWRSLFFYDRLFRPGSVFLEYVRQSVSVSDVQPYRCVGEAELQAAMMRSSHQVDFSAEILILHMNSDAGRLRWLLQ